MCVCEGGGEQVLEVKCGWFISKSEERRWTSSRAVTVDE